MVEEQMQAERVQPAALRPSDELRETLDQLDNLVSILRRHTPDEIEVIPGLFERAEVLLARLKKSSKEFQAEESRLRTLLNQFDNQAAIFVRKLGAGRVVRLRQAASGAGPLPEDHWWWYVDRLVAARRRARLIRLGMGAAIVTVIILVLVFLYQQFLAPDPNLVAAYGHRGRAEDLAYNGDYQGALEEVDQGLSFLPEDTELLILKGVVLDALGEGDAAQTAYAAAKATLAEQPANFLILLAQEHIRINQPALAITDMQDALAAHPESAEAYYILAAAQESLDRVQEAYQSYSMAAQYAVQNGNTQLEAMARMQLANLTSRLMMPSSSQATTTP